MAGEAIMPSSPHRQDPSVDWAVFLAHASAASSGILFLWGLWQLAWRGSSSMAHVVGIAWLASGLLPLLSVLFSHSGGPFLYR